MYRRIRLPYETYHTARGFQQRDFLHTEIVSTRFSRGTICDFLTAVKIHQLLDCFVAGGLGGGGEGCRR